MNIKHLLDYLKIRRCYVCKEEKWRIIRTEAKIDEQDRTKIFSMEYECLTCGTKEKRQVESSDTYYERDVTESDFLSTI